MKKMITDRRAGAVFLTGAVGRRSMRRAAGRVRGRPVQKSAGRPEVSPNGGVRPAGQGSYL